MAFLTMIAPMVAMTYPIDKINDGSAQGFTKWFREYIFNLLIQPMHLLLYYILITSAFELAGENIIYSIVAIGFMIPAEKLLRSLFGFEKASTPSTMNGAAGAALVMGGLSKLASLGGKGGKSGNKAIARGSSGSSGDNSEGSSSNNGSVRQVTLDGDVDETAEMAKVGTTSLPEREEKQKSIDDDQEALDKLKSEATKEEEKEYLDSEQADIDKRQSELDANSKQEELKAQKDQQEDLARDRITTQSYSNDSLKEKRKKIGGYERINARTYKARMNALNRVKALPGKTIRFAGKFAGTAGAAAIGVAAGVASGDPSDVLRNVAAGAGAGYIAGRNLGNSVSSGIDNNKYFKASDVDAGYRRLMNKDGYEDIAKEQLVKSKKKEYKEALRNNNFKREDIKRMDEDGTINRYILNEISAQDAATAELMRKEDSSITQEQAIADAKYAERVGDKYKGPDRKKWQEHFSGEFQQKASLNKKQADVAAEQAMKRVDRFNKYKKKTI